MRVRLRVGNAMGTGALLLAETGANQAGAPLLVPSQYGCPDRRFAVSKENYSMDAARRRIGQLSSVFITRSIGEVPSMPATR